jgi:hypothetical protein
MQRPQSPFRSPLSLTGLSINDLSNLRYSVDKELSHRRDVPKRPQSPAYRLTSRSLTDCSETTVRYDDEMARPSSAISRASSTQVTPRRPLSARGPSPSRRLVTDMAPPLSARGTSLRDAGVAVTTSTRMGSLFFELS